MSVHREHLLGTVLGLRPEPGAGGARAQGPEPMEALSICPGAGPQGVWSGSEFLTWRLLFQIDIHKWPSPAQLSFAFRSWGSVVTMGQEMVQACPTTRPAGAKLRLLRPVEGKRLISKRLVAVSWGGAFPSPGTPWFCHHLLFYMKSVSGPAFGGVHSHVWVCRPYST